VIVEIGLVALAVALVSGVVLSVLKHRYDGRFRRVRPAHQVPAQPEVAKSDVVVLTAADLGEPLGERVTLLQFSSAFCAPCRATHRILAEVARMVDGVRHVELDAESNLELVRRLDILRTPTVLVLDAAGELVTRASGQPRKADVIAAVGKAVDRQAA
jgi:thiol-disulfide isomerase/thioredoxin